jgi:FtsP/CotA-like multicopper oxidase with cupredoxin domain
LPTTNSGFLKFTAGGSVLLLAVPAANVAGAVNSLAGTRLDYLTTDASRAGFAKNGAVRLTLSSTTPQSIDLTATTATGVNAGDTAFASFGRLTLVNDGAADVTIAPSGSNGARLGMAGAVTVPAGATHVHNFPANPAVDSTHKSMDITPTAGGSFVLIISGA